MRGWILYRDQLDNLKEIPYEMKRFTEVAEKMGIELNIYKPEQFDLMVSRDDHKSILLEGKPVDLPDFMLVRLGASTTYFGQAVVRQIESQGVLVLNPSSGIDKSKDKLYAQQILTSSGLPVPRTALLKFPLNSELIEKKLKFPTVIKTLSGSKGSGVFLAKNRGEFEDLIDFIESTKGNANLIAQEFLESSHGRDLRIFVIGGRIVACMQRFSETGSFKANVSRGGNVKPYPISREIEWLAVETARMLDLDIAGVDLLFNGERFMVCEANSSPGFKGIEKCFPDLNIAEEIFNYVQIRSGIFPTPSAEIPTSVEIPSEASEPQK